MTTPRWTEVALAAVEEAVLRVAPQVEAMTERDPCRGCGPAFRDLGCPSCHLEGVLAGGGWGVAFGLDFGGGDLGAAPRPGRCPKGSLGLFATVSSSD